MNPNSTIRETDLEMNYENETRETITKKNSNTFKKPKVTYDDILNVLTQGVSNQSWYSQPQPQYIQQQQETNKKVKYNVSPDLDPNSKIMQKYFTNHKNQQQQQQQQYLYFQTKEEYQHYLFQQKMKILREKKRLEEIKPKKMAFLSENTARFSSNVNPMFTLNRLQKK